MTGSDGPGRPRGVARAVRVPGGGPLRAPVGLRVDGAADRARAGWLLVRAFWGSCPGNLSAAVTVGAVVLAAGGLPWWATLVVTVALTPVVWCAITYVTGACLARRSWMVHDENGKGVAVLHVRGGTVSNVAAWPRGAGHGSALLHCLTGAADDAGVDLMLRCHPDREPFYGRHQFRDRQREGRAGCVDAPFRRVDPGGPQNGGTHGAQTRLVFGVSEQPQRRRPTVSTLTATPAVEVIVLTDDTTGEMTTEQVAAQWLAEQVGRPFPQRMVHQNGQMIRWDHARVAQLMADQFDWWVDAAAYYMGLVEKGCTDAIGDVRDALDTAYTYAPKAKRETYLANRPTR